VQTLEKEFDMDNIIQVLVQEKALKTAKPLNEITFHRGKGCEHCNLQGYKGRIGLFETLENTEAIKDLIVANAPANKINTQAIADGMITMAQDAFIKAVSGITSIDEILRVTKE